MLELRCEKTYGRGWGRPSPPLLALTNLVAILKGLDHPIVAS